MSALPPLLRVCIVDDEALARQRLRSLLERAQQAGEPPPARVEITGECGEAEEAIALIRNHQPDVVFLDIEMPGLNGFDIVDILGDVCPQIVFVTAYDSYALEAFEVSAADYLTKPVRLMRLKDCLKRLTKRAVPGQLQPENASLLHRISAASATGIEVIELPQIQHFETHGKIVYVHYDKGKKQLDFTLEELEQRLPAQAFLRLHRSIIVRIDHIKSIEPWFSGNWRAITKNGTALPIARRRIKAVKQALGYSTR